MNLFQFSCFLGCLFLPGIAFSQATVHVELADIKAAGKGQLIALMYRTSEGFPRDHDKAAYRISTTDYHNRASMTFTGIVPGEYAIMVYQDLNNNGAMDTNFIGMPKEPLGLTNLASMSRPVFSRSLVKVAPPSLTITIKLLNQ
ncbi:DUF2141 domain-containing protein [Neolewinella lacunae]|uniref:DUF2141 domain-containing protein n=1 Tax=Neolewinella lacunae TaxID=1517758 RepID=A0A923PLU3_9BACT|nr:DUF2141 domain-containing protein [Neolewinella lacunae]MBC6995091.1 DUF2141 domain-containing protein [Neolewinella lacunae]MDN3634041.1 DUF2141 domain-containing protein [Neolewinella lacunae]